MISFSSGLSPGHAKTYYTRELAAPENRILGDLESGQVSHHGAVAIHLGLIDPRSHSAETFRNLCDGLSPDGEEVLVAARNGWERSAARQARGANARNAGWDVNISPHKSVSIAALVLADPRIVDAHRAAVRASLPVLESSICTRTSDGRKAEPTGALLATTFDHAVSRELDPQLHTHVFIHNITVDRSGRTRAVYIPPTFRARDPIAEAYSESLDRRLSDLGYRTSRETRTGAVRIEGVPQPLLERFSTRSRQARESTGHILAAARGQADRKAPTARTLHRWAASASRRRKPAHVDWRELRVRWSEQLRELGIEPDDLRLEIQNLGRSLRASEPQQLDEAAGSTRGSRIPDTKIGAATAAVPEATLLASGERPEGVPDLARSAAFAASDAAEAISETLTGEEAEGLRPPGRFARAVAHLAAGAIEAATDDGFLASLRAAAERAKGPRPAGDSTQLETQAQPAPVPGLGKLHFEASTGPKERAVGTPAAGRTSRASTRSNLEPEP